MSIKKLLLISGLAVFSSVSAQKTHTVAKGDNPYSIARKYGLTLDELVRLNPSAKDGKLNIGDQLVISKKTSAPAKKELPAGKPAAKAQGKIILQPKQTVYGITKQYHISEAELRAMNPDLDSHMKIGEEIALPLENIRKYGDARAAAAPIAKTETPVATPEAASGDTYEIQKQDNYYRITKKFGLSKADLLALNPGLEAKGLQPGDIIKIKGTAAPAFAETKAEGSTALPGDDFVTYTVVSGDTVFGILNRYGVSLDDLLTLNPSLSDGLKTGMVLKIKKQDQAYVKTAGDVLNVVLMLPFGFDTNDTKFRSMSADFLTGAKLAVERNARAGQKLDIKVIDAGNEASFKNSLSQINQNNTDLIIGPFLKSNVIEVLNFLGSKKIPVVAPFANSEELYKYSNLIIVETGDEVFADKIAREVGQVYSNQKIFIVAGQDRSNAELIRKNLEKSLSNPEVKIVNTPQDIQADKNMMTGQNAPVIAVLAAPEDSAGAAFAARVIALSQDTPGMKAFSMYYHPAFEKKQDELTQASLVYLMDRKITDGSFEKEVLADYKQKYCKTPPKYAVIGFDVVNDILTRENKRGEVFKKIDKVQTQLATKFEYVRAKNNGAYVNTGYRVVRLLP